MIEEKKFIPEKITKPIQLLAAWLAGLLAINTCFLVAATNLGTGKWEAGALIIAAIVNVPLFLLAVFLLQTKFRPEMQEDSYYSSYLSSKTNLPITTSKHDVLLRELNSKLEKFENRERLSIESKNNASHIQELFFGINIHLKDREMIKSKLFEAGVFRCTSFGPENPPQGRNMSISQYLPNEVVKELIQLGRQLGFESYNLWDNIGEESEEDVLLGSYGKSRYEIASA